MLATTSQPARLGNGRFLSRACAVCGYGTLQQDGVGASGRQNWTCDGLVDPPRDDMDLDACPGAVIDGELVGT